MKCKKLILFFMLLFVLIYSYFSTMRYIDYFRELGIPPTFDTICENCNYPNNNKFCTNCGYDSIKIVEDSYCTFCKHTQYNYSYCKDCGNKLGYEISINDLDISLEELSKQQSKCMYYSIMTVIFIIAFLINTFMIFLNIIGKIDAYSTVRKAKLQK